MEGFLVLLFFKNFYSTAHYLKSSMSHRQVSFKKVHSKWKYKKTDCNLGLLQAALSHQLKFFLIFRVLLFNIWNTNFCYKLSLCEK